MDGWMDSHARFAPRQWTCLFPPHDTPSGSLKHTPKKKAYPATIYCCISQPALYSCLVVDCRCRSSQALIALSLFFPINP